MSSPKEADIAIDVSGQINPSPDQKRDFTCPGKKPCPHIPHCPADYDKKAPKCLVKRLKPLAGLQFTTYVQGIGPVGSAPTIPAGGSVAPGPGTLGFTGIVQVLGADYIEMQMNSRVLYIPLDAMASMAPGGPLVAAAKPVQTATLPSAVVIDTPVTGPVDPCSSL